MVKLGSGIELGGTDPKLPQVVEVQHKLLTHDWEIGGIWKIKISRG